jgi:hypothetical protein
MAFFSAGTWLAIGIGSTLAGGAYSAYSSYEQGQNSAALARYNAQQQAAQNNYALQASSAKSLAERDENQKILAQQEAAYAASGVVVNSGSPLLVKQKQSALLERKALLTDYQGAIDYRVGTGRVTNDLAEANSDKQAGGLNAAGTLLSTAGKVATTYAGYGG